MPKNKVLTLYQKAKICEMSFTPGFNEEKCEKEFGIQRSCLNKILQSKTKFLDFADSKKVNINRNSCLRGSFMTLKFCYQIGYRKEMSKDTQCVICNASFQKYLKLICQPHGS